MIWAGNKTKGFKHGETVDCTGLWDEREERGERLVYPRVRPKDDLQSALQKIWESAPMPEHIFFTGDDLSASQASA